MRYFNSAKLQDAMIIETLRVVANLFRNHFIRDRRAILSISIFLYTQDIFIVQQ